MAPLKAMLAELKALNDKCMGGQALNYFAEKSYCPSQDDSPKLAKNQFTPESGGQFDRFFQFSHYSFVLAHISSLNLHQILNH